MKNKTPGAGRIAAGYLLGAILAVVSPLILLTELMTPMIVVLVPPAALVAINRWCGRAPALFSALLQLVVSALYMGGPFLWISFFLTLMPLLIILRNEDKPFFDQIKTAISVFGMGVLFSVVVLYISYGGNMIERVLLELPKSLRALPQEYMQIIMDNFAASFSMPLTVDGFYELFDQAINAMIPVYQMNLPGLIFGGALVSAVLCVGLNGYMRSRGDPSAKGVFVPLREWALPASTTGGLLLILAVSYAMSAFGMQNGETVFYTVLSIASAAFCIQALSSMARNMYISRLKQGVRVAIMIAFAVLCLSGASTYVTIYGIASALFGRKGAMRQRADAMNQNNNDHSDHSNEDD